MPSLPYPGITNLGETCYSAAAVQIIRKINEIAGRKPPMDISPENFENQASDSEECLKGLI